MLLGFWLLLLLLLRLLLLGLHVCVVLFEKIHVHHVHVPDGLQFLLAELVVSQVRHDSLPGVEHWRKNLW